MDVFEHCHKVNDLLATGQDAEARSETIRLLATLREDGLAYSPLVNRLIREVGLFPYLDARTASWQERYVSEVFKADVGVDEPITLHREQSRLLSALLDGKSIAVSAPTSFGKSFVIDAFISMRNPSNVVIIVPTIALADETRRRLQRKFGGRYKIITTSDETLFFKNILIFPQERAIGYSRALRHIDILIVDEFYKASKSFDKERSPSLIRAIISLSKIASQRYFLAPNIEVLEDNPFTVGMEFLRLDFNTVVLEKTEIYSEIGRNEQKKSEVLLGILNANPGKTLIYAGTYTNVSKISTLLMTHLESLDRSLLAQFQTWLAKNYDPNWALTNLVIKGVGFHNGQLHRSLSQIQIRLFEEDGGIDRIISTSSIIEGVNTSAEVVVLWSNKNGTAKINNFTYKNIIGRGGRMFRHFVGKIFVLEEPPDDASTQLQIEMPEELLGTSEAESFGMEFTRDQVAAIENYKRSMQELFGSDDYQDFLENDVLQSSNTHLVLNIAREIKANSTSWNGLGYLNADDPDRWDHYLYKLINLLPGGWGIEYGKYVAFVKILSKNWLRSIPEFLDELDDYDIGIDDFFELERNTAYKLACLLGDVHAIYNRMNTRNPIDLTPAISRMSHAFLPRVVYNLEEYGMPRMISKKIHLAGVLNFEDDTLDLHKALESFRTIGQEGLTRSVGDLDDFDMYILRYFYEGIEFRRDSSVL